jgi:cell division protein FtsB
MTITGKIWDALTTVIKMNDKIVATSEQMKAQQQKIENLTQRVIRLETTLELLAAERGRKRIRKPDTQ